MIITLTEQERALLTAVRDEIRRGQEKMSAVLSGMIAARDRRAVGAVKLADDLTTIELPEE